MNNGNESRWLSLDKLAEYASISPGQAVKLGEISGARRKIGRRNVYDKQAIDAYINEQVPTKEAAK